MRTPSLPRILLTHALLTLLTLLTLFPVLWVVKMALDPSQGMSLSFNPLPTVVSFENFRSPALTRSKHTTHSEEVTHPHSHILERKLLFTCILCICCNDFKPVPFRMIDSVKLSVTLTAEKTHIQLLAKALEEFLTGIYEKRPDLPPASDDYVEAA